MSIDPQWERWIATARDWVLAVERAYVQAAFGPPAPPAPQGEPALLAAVAAAAAGAVASRFLAVGTPRSIGLIGDRTAGALSLAAHHAWFRPADIRCAAIGPAAAALQPGGADRAGELSGHAVSLSGRAVSIDEALAADIVCIHAPLSLAAAQLRRGTHVNALAPVTLDDELRALATIADEPAGLAALAAGLRDGRQLDELTVFLAGDLAVARRALAAPR